MTTYHGYATHFDVDSRQWIHLSEEACLINFSVPPAVHLCNAATRAPLLNIELNNFHYHSQTTTSVVVSTEATATVPCGGSPELQMYGFRFSDEVTAGRFSAQLQSLSQYHQQAYNNFATQNNTSSQGISKPGVARPFHTLDPNIHKQQQPLGGVHSGMMPGKPVLQNYMNATSNNNNNNNNNNNSSNNNNMTNSPLPGGGTGARPRDITAPVTDDNKSKLDGFIKDHKTDEAFLLLTEEEELCNKLTQYIEKGEVAGAENIVAQLAEKMTKTVITPQLPKRGTDFNIFIQIRDKNDTGQGTMVTETVDPHNTSIAMLKYLVFRKYQFPMDIQLWIIGSCVGKDEDTLAQCGVKATGTTVFLYLKSTDKPEPIVDADAQTDDTITRFSQTQMNRQNMRQQQAEFAGNHTVQCGGDGNLRAEQPAQRRAAVEVQERLGWNCEQCTFRNLPTFPFCKICMHQRPADFEVPDDYVMLQEEVSY